MVGRQRSQKAVARQLRRLKREIATTNASESGERPADAPDNTPRPDFDAVMSLLEQNDNDEETFHQVESLLSPFDTLTRARIVIEAVTKSATHANDKPLQYLAISLAVRILHPFWPRNEQLDVIHHLMFAKEDMLLAAKTSFGKSLVFQSVSLLESNSMTIIIIPLNQIGREQLHSINDAGGKAYFLNGDTNTPEARSRIANGEFTHLFTSPELAVCDQLRKIFQNPTLSRLVRLVVIDEAHLVHQWGDKFRVKYACLMQLRITLGRKVPWFACSATLPPRTVRILKKRCGFRDNVEFKKLSVDRPELTWTVGIIPSNTGAKFETLRFIFDTTTRRVTRTVSSHVHPSSIPKTVVFFNTRQEAYNAQEVLIEFLRSHHRFRYTKQHCLDMLKVYTRDTPEFDKASIIEKFKMPGETSPVRVVFATEALGLGVDLPDIRRVVQYKLTDSKEPSVLWQRGGRACRDHERGGVILLAEEWAIGPRTQSQTPPNEEEEDWGVMDEQAEPDNNNSELRTAAEKKLAKKRGLLPHFWYWLLNKPKCFRDAFLNYFNEKAEFRTPQHKRTMCCSRCCPELDLGVVSLDSYPHCYMYHERGPRSNALGKRVMKVAIKWALEKAKVHFANARFTPKAHMILPVWAQRAIEQNAMRLANPEGFRKVLGKWKFFDSHGEELLEILTPAVYGRATKSESQGLSWQVCSSIPAFETFKTQTQPSRIYETQLTTNPVFTTPEDIENATPSSSNKRRDPLPQDVAQSKRRCLADVTNLK